MKLIIVESPTKARTISQFLKKDFRVESSYGHVRDLPIRSLSVDIENNFEPKYVILPKAKKRVAELKSEAKKSEKVILATDEDREGEAIAWHLTYALALNAKQAPSSKLQAPKIERIVFHEITKTAIENALKNPRDIDMKLVDAQQARRILDRLVGYKLSPFLWKKVAKGLSAGRVQSVAVRLVVEREKEITDFKPEEYHTISVLLQKLNTINTEFLAQLIRIGGAKLEKFSIKTADEAKKIVKDLEGAGFKVEKLEKKELKRQPLPPFTTSTLQQTAFSKFGFSAKQTMMLAQQLYESGLITYMRTDSLNLSKEAVTSARQKVETAFGKNYLSEIPRIFKTKSKSAQEAHEAIRATSAGTEPELLSKKLTPQQFKLYDLIWRRFIATQMSNAVFEATAADIITWKPRFQAETGFPLPNTKYTFRATGNVLKFDGFLRVYQQKTSETELPPLTESENLDLKNLKDEQHFTEPPPRFNEASLIKTLEEYGIGRPSTYAPIIATIQDRRYVIKDDQKRLKPTDIGVLVNGILVEHFPNIVDTGFTASMEEHLDDIASGKRQWQIVIKEFWTPFKETLDKKSEELNKKEIATEETELKCPECGKNLIIRMGRYGKFYACSGFPKCRYTATIGKNEDGKPESKEDLGPCKKCETGKIVKRKTKRGRTFWGCSNWPKCDFASWENPKPLPTNNEDAEEEDA